MTQNIADSLLHWYDHHRRILPWRALAGQVADPYGVWLSEIMLQQTTVAVVIPYYQAFLTRWPTVERLAAAPLDDVLAAWAGLGYYARARNLHACARQVADHYQGQFPQQESDLRRLPGIGDYTAAAIAAIAFDQRAVVVDGNVERVVSRLFALTDPLPSVKPQIRQHTDMITPQQRCGDFAQAMMDLGASLCSPTRPACGLCPLMKACQGRAAGIAESLPGKTPRPERPTRRTMAFWLSRRDGAVLLRLRPPKGLLGGMAEFPSTPWEEQAHWTLDQAVHHAPLAAAWHVVPGMVRHTFSHFHLEIQVAMARTPQVQPLVKGFWCPLEQLDAQALPSVMKKLARHVLHKGYTA